MGGFGGEKKQEGEFSEDGSGSESCAMGYPGWRGIWRPSQPALLVDRCAGFRCDRALRKLLTQSRRRRRGAGAAEGLLMRLVGTFPIKIRFFRDNRQENISGTSCGNERQSHLSYGRERPMPMSAFISYSHADEKALARMHKHLAMLSPDGLISPGMTAPSCRGTGSTRPSPANSTGATCSSRWSAQITWPQAIATRPNSSGRSSLPGPDRSASAVEEAHDIACADARADRK